MAGQATAQGWVRGIKYVSQWAQQNVTWPKLTLTSGQCLELARDCVLLRSLKGSAAEQDEKAPPAEGPGTTVASSKPMLNDDGL